MEDPLVEAQVQRLLQEAGLENAPFDPASFEALKQHIKKSTDAGKPLFASTPTTKPAPQTPEPSQPPLQNVDIYGPTPPQNTNNDNAAALFSPMASDVTDPGSSVRPANVNNNNTTEARILEQLRVQTSLIIHLQRRVDALSDQVKEQQRRNDEQLMLAMSQGIPSFSTNHSPMVPPQTQAAPPQAPRNAVATAPPPPVPAPVGAQPPPPPRADVARRVLAQVQAAAAPPPPQPPQPRGLWRFLLQPWTFLRNSRLAKLFAVFVKLRQQEVQPVQWGVLVKVLVMMTILFGRMASSSHKRHAAQEQESVLANIPTKFYILLAIVVLGLMGQTGDLSFLYKFVVKERYPHRILLEGEDADAILQEVEELGRPDPRRRAARPPVAGGNNGGPQGDGGEGGFHWNHTFLFGGRIAQQGQEEPAEEGQAVPPVQRGIVASLWDAISDVFYLFGSFFLSVFPMWRPQGPPQPPMRDGGGGEPVPEGGPPNNNGGGDEGGPGQVRPPVDPAADDDDDDDDDDDQ